MAIGTTRNQENVVVKLIAEDGTVGWGEAPHMVGHSQRGETPSTVRVVLSEKLWPAVAGLSAYDQERLGMAMDRAVPGNLRAKGAVIMAAYDLASRATAVPLHALLGGKVRDRVLLSWSLPIQDGKLVVEEALRMVERGWKILKVKIGRDSPDEDAKVVLDVRKAIGDDVELRVDANQAYDVKAAVRFARQTEAADLGFFEQPVHRDDLDGLAEVRSSVSVPVMADESAHTPEDIVRIGRSRAADCVSIYIIGPGGIHRSREMAIIARSFGMSGYVGGALESTIGASAGLHLAASCPAITLGCEMTGLYLLSDNLSEESIVMEDGALVVPTGPGLGPEVSDSKLAHYRVGEVERLTATSGS